MATPITITKKRLRAGSAIPKNPGGSCPPGAPVSYIIQTFGAEVSEVDNWESLIGLYGSEVMQGLQNFEDSASFRSSSYARISYTGTNNRNTDGDQIFRGTEEHTSEWMDEVAAGLVWVS